MNRRLVRSTAAAACRLSLALLAAERYVRGRLVILCYHRVLPIEQKRAYFLPHLVVTPESFRRQCLALRRRYEVLPLHEALKAQRERDDRGPPLAAITFDDGYGDNFLHAAPILDQTGIRATFFVIADLVGAGQTPWYDRMGRAAGKLEHGERLQPLLDEVETADEPHRSADQGKAALRPREIVAQAKKLSPSRRQDLLARLCTEADIDRSPLSPTDTIMDWSQLATLAHRGHEIGSHGARHEILPQLDNDTLWQEVAGSRETLEKGLEKDVNSFCYPNGDFDQRVAGAVQQAGYHASVTVVPGVNDVSTNAYRLRRWPIDEERLAGPLGRTSDTLLRMELSGLAARLFRRRQREADQR